MERRLTGRAAQHSGFGGFGAEGWGGFFSALGPEKKCFPVSYRLRLPAGIGAVRGMVDLSRSGFPRASGSGVKDGLAVVPVSPGLSEEPVLRGWFSWIFCGVPSAGNKNILLF